MVMLCFQEIQAGASPGPEPSRKITVTIKASALVVSPRGGMQRAWPGPGPGQAHQGSVTRAKARRAASRLAPEEASRSLAGRRGLVLTKERSHQVRRQGSMARQAHDIHTTFFSKNTTIFSKLQLFSPNDDFFLQTE